MTVERFRVLFVCVGNSCRSQIAEALARHLAPDVIESSSAGISPLGHIEAATRLVLLERGIAMDGQYSKGLRDVDPVGADLIVNLTGIPGQSLFPGRPNEDWEVSDPYDEDLGVYRRIRDEIESLVVDLAGRLRHSRMDS